MKLSMLLLGMAAASMVVFADAVGSALESPLVDKGLLATAVAALIWVIKQQHGTFTAAFTESNKRDQTQLDIFTAALDKIVERDYSQHEATLTASAKLQAAIETLQIHCAKVHAEELADQLAKRAYVQAMEAKSQEPSDG